MESGFPWSLGAAWVQGMLRVPSSEFEWILRVAERSLMLY